MVIRNGTRLTWKWLAVGILIPILAFGAITAIYAKIEEDKTQNVKIDSLGRENEFNKAVMMQLVNTVNDMKPKVDTILIYVKAQDLIDER